MSTVSTKETAALGEQCSRCLLWYAFVHPSLDGGFLCRTCIELEGVNRTAGGDGLPGRRDERRTRSGLRMCAGAQPHLA